MTQQQLAERLGVSASTVGMYEQGRREPPIETLLALCSCFNVSAGYLLGSDTGHDVMDMLDEMRNRVRSDKKLMFNGVPISSEQTDRLFDAMYVAASVMFNSQCLGKDKQSESN